MTRHESDIGPLLLLLRLLLPMLLLLRWLRRWFLFSTATTTTSPPAPPSPLSITENEKWNRRKKRNLRKEFRWIITFMHNEFSFINCTLNGVTIMNLTRILLCMISIVSIRTSHRASADITLIRRNLLCRLPRMFYTRRVDVDVEAKHGQNDDSIYSNRQT